MFFLFWGPCTSRVVQRLSGATSDGRIVGSVPSLPTHVSKWTPNATTLQVVTGWFPFLEQSRHQVNRTMNVKHALGLNKNRKGLARGPLLYLGSPFVSPPCCVCCTECIQLANSRFPPVIFAKDP